MPDLLYKPLKFNGAKNKEGGGEIFRLGKGEKKA